MSDDRRFVRCQGMLVGGQDVAHRGVAEAPRACLLQTRNELLPGAGLLVPKRFGLAWTNGSLRGWAIVGVALICAMVALWRKMLRRRALHDHLRMLAPAGGGGAPRVRRLADAAAALSQQNGGSVHSAVQQLLERL